jgi:protein-disulfide isomerase
LKRENLIAYAESLGIDPEKFVSALDAMKFKSTVENDVAEGMRLGVMGTPTFFINGKRYAGALPLTTFQAIIDAQLTAAGIKTPAQLLASACTRGAETSPIILTVFADFQSAISAHAAWTLEEILSLYPEKASLIFRHFPLETHPDAMLAHEAALAAAQQGKFWEMHDLLFSGQADFKREKLLEFSRELGLDDSKIAQALTDHRFAAFISHDLEEGKKLGVSGVPTIFINDRRVDGLEPVSVLRSIIDEKLAKATASAHSEPSGALQNP